MSFSSRASARPCLTRGVGVVFVALSAQHAFAQASPPAPSAAAPVTPVPPVVATPSASPVKPIGAKPPATEKDASAKPKIATPQKPPASQPPQEPAVVSESVPTRNPANPGTPSANVTPVTGIAGNPVGQTAASVGEAQAVNRPVFSVGDLVKNSPGVSIKQGNGPRDLGVSIRGSNARNGFGIRNIVILEDGFPVTQPDGLSRSDLIDPHAYTAVDVWRGPSSMMFGNYATGGALNFRSRPGGEINGLVYGIDVGSFNYLNNYSYGGFKSGGIEASAFVSDVRGDGHFEYSAFNTQTINALITYRPTPEDTITLKAINNTLETELPFRMSLNQFRQNPFQEGCRTAVGAAAGCVTNNFSATNTNPRVAQTAEQAGANRDDRRTIGGLRWEHQYDESVSTRLQFVIDDRNISQPTGTTSAVGDFLSYNVIADASLIHRVGSLPANYTIGAFANYLPVDSQTWNVAPGGNARLGKLQSETDGSTTNYGVRAREEVAVSPGVIVAAGLGIERTLLEGSQRSFTYNAAGVTTATAYVSADRGFTNVAPELGVLVKPNDQWQVRGRVAAGYGTPQFSNLFVTPAGVPGNNTQLESQENVGYDLGIDWTPTKGVLFSITGFYEFFTNEIVSQSAGAGLQNFSFNAPKSEHRGVEVAVDISLPSGFRVTAAYLYNDQYYTEYTERLSVAGLSRTFDRSGNKIPGVAPNELIARLAYDVPSGPLKGLGAFVEYEWHDGFFMENGNLLTAPGYEVVNVNVHYAVDLPSGPVKSLLAFAEVRNVFDETYISAANNITNTLAANGTQNGASVLSNTSGSIYAGAPRTYFGGVKLKF